MNPDLIKDCVHCGFCLPTCPTYVLWGAEADSPRGRIHLMEQRVGGAPMSDAMALHFDRCLGCMACVTACPSGVRYDLLIEQTRAHVEASHPRTLKERLLRGAIFRLFPYPRRLRLMRGPLRLYQALGLRLRGTGTLSTLESLAPRLTKAPRLPASVKAVGKRRAVVGLLTGCVQSAFFPDVNAATARVLAAEGCDVVIPPNQGCCGALSVHNGRAEEAQRFATALTETFQRAGVDFVVVNAAGCGSATKEYLPNARDFAELLAELGPVAPRHPLPLTVAYHDACHLAHAQGIRAQPRALLAGIPSLVVREITDPEICCGSAGIWNVLNPEPARELGERKARNVLATGADVLVTANPGCLMQIGAFVKGGMRLAHTAQVLDASINNRPLVSVR
ncbi:(Fe-S)-binding protein [Allorhizocola rhizosphaerae]|uniref:(Fe-S)-binding protein n=1 Tax=Allorhizocola rhizosphaerae TaxID=1872709 RepID=UPI000E3D5EF3|nr:heterodisulfide reductase-related iron-sulfur binding cluster [Allorhizocola rhizosphaerae]